MLDEVPDPPYFSARNCSEVVYCIISIVWTFLYYFTFEIFVKHSHGSALNVVLRDFHYYLSKNLRLKGTIISITMENENMKLKGTLPTVINILLLVFKKKSFHLSSYNVFKLFLIV